MKPIALALAVVVALARISGLKTEAFQAVAHLLVGGLFTAWYLKRTTHWTQLLPPWNDLGKPAKDWGGFELHLALILSAIEVACFVWFKHFAGAQP